MGDKALHPKPDSWSQVAANVHAISDELEDRHVVVAFILTIIRGATRIFENVTINADFSIPTALSGPMDNRLPLSKQTAETLVAAKFLSMLSMCEAISALRC